MLSRVSIQSKLILMLVLCTVLAAAVVGAIAFKTGRDGLRAGAITRLTEIRAAQERDLTAMVADLRNALMIYTSGVTAVDSLRDFTAGFDELQKEQITPEQDRLIADYYTNVFAKDTQKYTGYRLNVPALLPSSNAQRYLQSFYTAKLPTNDQAIAMDDARDGSTWSAAHIKYHRFYREIVTRFAFEDALLIDARGNVVYSAYKNVDLGTNILDGPYSRSKLKDAFTEAMSSNDTDRVVLTDFELYQAATMAPTAWLVAPIPPIGKPQGVMALQFPITKINKLMTFDGKWTESGLGQTGETILVGEDLLMRSNSRLFLENPDEYRQRVIDAGTPPDIPDLAIRQGGTTLVQPVPPDSAIEAEKGRTSTTIIKDYLGSETVQAYAPIEGTWDPRWAIIAKITTAESFAPEAVFTRTVVLATTAIIFVVCLLAAVLARVFLRPIRRLEAGVARISAGDFNVAIPVETRDEIGDLTEGFNEMSRNLAVKADLLTERQSEISRLLKSLMPHAVAEKVGRGDVITPREHVNVSVIFLDVVGLDRIQTELDSESFLAIASELSRQFDAAGEEYGIERVRPVRNGYMGSCGLTVPRLDNIQRTVEFALECERIVERTNGEAGTDLQLRAGIDNGTINSGLVAQPSFIYDLWGTAVNLASQIKDGATRPGIYATVRIRDVLAETMDFESAGRIDVAGREEPVWRVTGRR
ncbi:MAG: adenylate/guanylate cyclase domain-containing protein [Mycobacterium sp.]|nr:adenylate/guanylate cyclase domain-containing protein [Mycobacterium sp.]